MNRKDDEVNAPGENEVRMRYIAQLDLELQMETPKMFKFMLVNDGTKR